MTNKPPWQRSLEGDEFMMARKPKCQHLKADVHVIAIAGQQRDGYTVAFLLLFA